MFKYLAHSSPTKNPRFGCRLRVNHWGKSGVDMGVNEPFGLLDLHCEDAPNMGFFYV
jgi:hypothetical protein